MSELIAFIGIGNMGSPMAENLVKAGKKVRAFDISKKIIEQAKEKNLDIVENLDELITNEVTTVITMLPEGKNSKEVYLGDNGIINKVSKNCLLIDCSTIDIKTSIEIGKKESFDLALPLLKIMGKNIFHAGDLGSGNGAKICNNMSLGITMIAASESLMLAKRLNIDIKKVHEIMKNASGNSWPISIYPPLPGLIEGTPSNNNYRPGFSAGMMNKDLKLANECAKQVNASTPLGAMALNIYNKFCEEGNDNKDFSAISKVIGKDAWDYPID